MRKISRLLIIGAFAIILMLVSVACARAYADDRPIESTTAQTTVAETTAETITEVTTITTTTMRSTAYYTTKQYTTKTATTSAKKQSSDVDFSGTISASDIPSFSEWDRIGYITCSGAGLNHVPITYGWAQSICDSSQIVMADYRDEVFGQGENVILCGHNYKALKNLKNVSVGDTIVIETTYGANFKYRVTRSCKALLSQPGDEFLGIKDVDDSRYYMGAFDSGNTLGIFTCYSSASSDYRWFVQATMIDGTTIE